MHNKPIAEAGVSKTNAGLAGVIAGETAICTVGKDATGLTYRGYEIQDLADKASFEEVAYLLLHGELPTQQQLSVYQEQLIAGQELPDGVKNILEQLPASAHPMDVLRTACSALGTLEPETVDFNAVQIAQRLMPFFASALLYWYCYHTKQQRIDVKSGEPTISGHILHLLYGGKVPDPAMRRALDVSLTLYAEHEFNSSTFAARVCAATLSDFYSAITAGIATLRGPLHGGANEAAIELIESFLPEFTKLYSKQSSLTTDDTTYINRIVQDKLQRFLASKQLIMGFGHRVYKTSDPRSDIIKKVAQENSTYAGAEDIHYLILLAIAQEIEKFMWEEKNLFPNLDFYSSLVYKRIGFNKTFFTPLFVIARTAGWGAHIIEQRANNKLIRPSAAYVGVAPRVFVTLQDR